ncbi:MAG: hypothetical protein ACO2ZE_13350 [Pseudohongiellaceae bacterium]|jgi:hypothetical protein
MKLKWLVLLVACLAPQVLAQDVGDMILHTPGPRGEGWQGFQDLGFLINAAANLLLAAVLGATIAYHPRHAQTADTFEEIEATQIYIMYAVIGSITGILVVQYGMAVGFVLFGIGALIRFRTVLRSANLTGRLIFVTLIGLSAGLDLPHVAILVTLFGFVLIFFLDARFTFRIFVRGLPHDCFNQAARAHRDVIEREDCRIISEKKDPDRGRVTFIIRSAQVNAGKILEASLQNEVEPSLMGSVDWEIG